MTRRNPTSFVSLLFTLLSLLLCFSAFMVFNSAKKTDTAEATIKAKSTYSINYTNLYTNHFFGAFSVDTPAEAAAAASEFIMDFLITLQVHKG